MPRRPVPVVTHPEARRPGRDRRPIERYVPQLGLSNRLYDGSGGAGNDNDGLHSPGGSLVPDSVFVDLLERARVPPYSFESVPQALQSLEESVVLRVTHRAMLTEAIGEVYHLCNEAGRRAAVKQHKARRRGSLSFPRPAPPLELNYVADRLDIDDPLWGYMVRHSTGGWLQGFLCVTTFTHWQLWFQWNSLAEEAVLGPRPASPPPVPVPPVPAPATVPSSHDLPPPPPSSLPLSPRSSRRSLEASSAAAKAAAPAPTAADPQPHASPTPIVVPRELTVAKGRFWEPVQGPRVRIPVKPLNQAPSSSSSSSTSSLGGSRDSHSSIASAAHSAASSSSSSSSSSMNRVVDWNGSLSKELDQQERSGDPTNEGVVWPRVAELSLLGALGCGKWLVQTLLAELTRGDEYDYVVLQATDSSLPFYETLGFVRVGAIARYANRPAPAPGGAASGAAAASFSSSSSSSGSAAAASSSSRVPPPSLKLDPQGSRVVGYRHWTFSDEPLDRSDGPEPSKMMCYKIQRPQKGGAPSSSSTSNTSAASSGTSSSSTSSSGKREKAPSAGALRLRAKRAALKAAAAEAQNKKIKGSKKADNTSESSESSKGTSSSSGTGASSGSINSNASSTASSMALEAQRTGLAAAEAVPKKSTTSRGVAATVAAVVAASASAAAPALSSSSSGSSTNNSISNSSTAATSTASNARGVIDLDAQAAQLASLNRVLVSTPPPIQPFPSSLLRFHSSSSKQPVEASSRFLSSEDEDDDDDDALFPCPSPSCHRKFTNYGAMYRHKQKRHPQLIKCRTSSSASSLTADADSVRSPAYDRSLPSTQRNHHSSSTSSSNSGSASRSSRSSSSGDSERYRPPPSTSPSAVEASQHEMSAEALSHKARLAEKEKARRLIQKLKRQADAAVKREAKKAAAEARTQEVLNGGCGSSRANASSTSKSAGEGGREIGIAFVDDDDVDDNREERRRHSSSGKRRLSPRNDRDSQQSAERSAGSKRPRPSSSHLPSQRSYPQPPPPSEGSCMPSSSRRKHQVIRDGHRGYGDIEQRLLSGPLQTAVEGDDASLSTDVWSNGFSIDHNNDEVFDDPASLTTSDLLGKSQSRSLRPPPPAAAKPARCLGSQVDNPF